MSDLNILDLYRLKPEFQFREIQKAKLMTELLDVKAEEKKGLDVTLGISTSARRINNRIYTPAGQQKGLKTWTEPFRKPMIHNHDMERDPVGRFVEVRQEYNNDAIKFFKDLRDYEKFKTEIMSDSPERIAKALKKHKLLHNKEWPGLTTLVGVVRVTDEDAVEKFLDQRYLTFSAGAVTDRYVCNICLSDWGQGDICEHVPGKLYDGEPCVHITGTYVGKEISILNNPANDFSFVRSLSLKDGDDNEIFNKQDFNVEVDSYIMDSAIDLGVDMKTEFPLKDARELVLEIFKDEQLGQELLDSLESGSHYEVAWLVRIHDALHQSYDWQVKYDDAKGALPKAVFGLHAKLHGLADTGGWRDSIINGALDGFDEAGEESERFKLPETITKDAEVEESSIVDAEVAAEPVADAIPEGQVSVEDQAVELDWMVLDYALAGIAGGSVEPEVIETLDKKLVCGPEGLFVIADEKRLEAARLLLTKVKLTDAQKAVLVEKIDLAAKALEDSVCGCRRCTCGSVEDVKINYAKLLLDHQELVEKVKALEPVLDSSVEAAENIDKPVTDTQHVENPSISSSQELPNTKKKTLGRFEQKIVDQYQEILAKDGVDNANAHLISKLRYLPPSFNIQDYIQENE